MGFFASDTLEGGSVVGTASGAATQELAYARTSWRAGDTLTKIIPYNSGNGGVVDLDHVEYQNRMTAVAATSLFTLQQAGDYVVSVGGQMQGKANDVPFSLLHNGSYVEMLNWKNQGVSTESDVLLKFKRITCAANDTLQLEWFASVSDDTTGFYTSPASLGLTNGITNAQATQIWIEVNQVPTLTPTGAGGQFTSVEITDATQELTNFQDWAKLNATTSAATAELPSSPEADQKHTITAKDITNTATLDGNGKNILYPYSPFTSTTVTFSTVNESITVRYDAVGDQWFIV